MYIFKLSAIASILCICLSTYCMEQICNKSKVIEQFSINNLPEDMRYIIVTKLIKGSSLMQVALGVHYVKALGCTNHSWYTYIKKKRKDIIEKIGSCLFFDTKPRLVFDNTRFYLDSALKDEIDKSFDFPKEVVGS